MRNKTSPVPLPSLLWIRPYPFPGVLRAANNGSILSRSPLPSGWKVWAGPAGSVMLSSRLSLPETPPAAGARLTADTERRGGCSLSESTRNRKLLARRWLKSRGKAMHRPVQVDRVSFFSSSTISGPGLVAPEGPATLSLLHPH